MPRNVPKINRIYLVLLFLTIAGWGTPVSGQTPLVTGNVNKYARVTSVSTDYVIVDDVSDFAAGDTVTGASLVVNAIASGRKVAKAIDLFLNTH